MKIEKLSDMYQYFGEEFVALEWAKEELRKARLKGDYKLIFQRIKDLRVAWSNIDLLFAHNSHQCSETEHMLMHLLLQDDPHNHKRLFDAVSSECLHMEVIADAFLKRAHTTKAEKDKELEKYTNP